MYQAFIEFPRWRILLLLTLSSTILFANDTQTQVMEIGAPTAYADPLESLREFMFALYANDAEGLGDTIVPNDRSGELLGKRILTQEEREKLKENIDQLGFRRSEPFTLLGEAAEKAADLGYPTGTKTKFVTWFRGKIIQIPIVKYPNRWKVNVDWWISMLSQYQRTDPEFASKAFFVGLIANKLEWVEEFSTGEVSAKALLKKLDLPGSDLGHIAMLADEMPISAARPWDLYTLPNGEAATTNNEPDKVILIGQFHSFDIPFELTKVNGHWKVVRYDYLRMLTEQGIL